MFEIIQILRGAKAPVTAETLADALEVTKRTVYRDVAALQGQRVPIEGEAGVGYIMRPGFDLPPLMFTPDEIEAIAVGLAMIRRAGDKGLLAAADRVAQKIGDVLPKGRDAMVQGAPVYVSGWHAIPSGTVDPELLRAVIRDEQVLRLTYCDESGRETDRTIRPIAVVYYTDALVLAAWCELRKGFRHFRIDRILTCESDRTPFRGGGRAIAQRVGARNTRVRAAQPPAPPARKLGEFLTEQEEQSALSGGRSMRVAPSRQIGSDAKRCTSGCGPCRSGQGIF